MTVSIDTMTLIWGVQGFGAKSGNLRQPDLKEKQFRARVLLELLEDRKEEIVIASVVVSEFLIGVPSARHKDFLAAIDKRFRVHPFDLPACALAASLWLQHKKHPPAGQADRTCLKADMLIVATAKLAGSAVFYTNDANCRNLASLANMRAEDLPTKHPEMFRNNDLRKEMNLPPL